MECVHRGVVVISLEILGRVDFTLDLIVLRKSHSGAARTGASETAADPELATEPRFRECSKWVPARTWGTR